jgi:hypothetical protein
VDSVDKKHVHRLSVCNPQKFVDKIKVRKGTLLAPIEREYRNNKPPGSYSGDPGGFTSSSDYSGRKFSCGKLALRNSYL